MTTDSIEAFVERKRRERPTFDPAATAALCKRPDDSVPREVHDALLDAVDIAVRDLRSESRVIKGAFADEVRAIASELEDASNTEPKDRL